MSTDYKYAIPVRTTDKRIKIPKEVKEQLKELRLYSRVKKMKSDVVDCPVKGKEVPFFECFLCKNFIRRVRGVVYCRGEEL